MFYYWEDVPTKELEGRWKRLFPSFGNLLLTKRLIVFFNKTILWVVNWGYIHPRQNTSSSTDEGNNKYNIYINNSAINIGSKFIRGIYLAGDKISITTLQFYSWENFFTLYRLLHTFHFILLSYKSLIRPMFKVHTSIPNTHCSIHHTLHYSYFI